MSYFPLDLTPRKGNRHTGGSGISIRQAKTIDGCARKLIVLAETEGMYRGYTFELERIVQKMYDLLKSADRIQ